MVLRYPNARAGTLQTMRVFGEENYDTLSTKTAVHSAKLLKKHDQCRAVYMCSHLFWKPDAEVDHPTPRARPSVCSS